MWVCVCVGGGGGVNGQDKKSPDLFFGETYMYNIKCMEWVMHRYSLVIDLVCIVDTYVKWILM